MLGFIEQMVIETIETYDRMADEYRKKADALRAEWQSLQVDKPAEQRVDPDGWIEWTGGDCPVDGRAVVYVKYRDGGISTSIAACFGWQRRCNDDGDIVAYKIVKEEA